jgi:hypothetical protein
MTESATVETATASTAADMPFHEKRSGTFRRVIALATTLAVLGSACGVAAGNSFELIPPQDIPFGLDQTTTTTTTTTIPVAEPGTTDPDSGPTTLPVQTEPIDAYFVIGLDRLQRQTLQFSSPVEPLQVLALLEEGPPPEQSVGLRTAVRPGLAVDVSTDRGVATVDLRGAVLDRMTPRDQRLAIAQLVLTVIGSIRGIGQVIFTIDGEPAEIGIPPEYTLSEPGEPLAYADFELLLATSPTTTSPTTTSPTTTSPTATSPADTSPTTTSPTATSPADTSPTATSPADTSPTTTSPATASPADTGPATTEPPN